MTIFEAYFTLTCCVIFAGIIVLSWFSLMLIIATGLIKSIMENPVGTIILKKVAKATGGVIFLVVLLAGLLYFSGNLSKIVLWSIIHYTLLLKIALFVVVTACAALFILPMVVHDQLENQIYAVLQSKEKASRYNHEEARDRAFDIYDWCILGAILIVMGSGTALVIVATLLEGCMLV